DVAQVIVPPPKQLAALLVTDGNYVLEKVINSLRLKAPDVMRPDAYEEAVPTKYDLIIFDRYRPKKLPPAGSFMYFGRVPAGLKLKAVTDASGKNVMLSDVEVLDWKRDHPILRNLGMS